MIAPAVLRTASFAVLLAAVGCNGSGTSLVATSLSTGAPAAAGSSAPIVAHAATEPVSIAAKAQDAPLALAAGESTTQAGVAAEKVATLAPKARPTDTGSANPIELAAVPSPPAAKAEPSAPQGFFARLRARNAQSSARGRQGGTRERGQIGYASRSSAASFRQRNGTRRAPPRRPANTVGLPGVDPNAAKPIIPVPGAAQAPKGDKAIQVASIGSMARRGAHGLILQRPNVKVGCFPKPLLAILKKVEKHYRRVPIVTSGFRSKRHNRRIRGARNSTHTRCLAADIQVKGVTKWQLAKFLRSLEGRGGVGTYCHTKSVHIDIAGPRDWHYCGRKRSKKRRRRKA